MYYAKGMCALHYGRVLKTGNPEIIKPTITEILMRNRKIDDAGCWLWTGTIGAYGYGVISKKGYERLIHRIAFTLFVGPIPENLFVCHKCDVRNCFNPSHLFLGTRIDNIMDCVSKNRHVRGTRNSASKLSESDIPEILSLCSMGVSKAIVARKYKVSRMLISRIVRNKNWKHVPREISNL
jgi:hypothetical protein